MTQEKQQQTLESIINILKSAIASSDQKWDNDVSHAQIVGYLQGTMKGIISFYGDDIKVKDKTL